MKTSKCRNCQATVVWAYTREGRCVPVDSVPVLDGDLVLERVPQIESPETYMALPYKPESHGGRTRYVSHLPICPRAHGWRDN
jgi:hypothetical protein